MTLLEMKGQNDKSVEKDGGGEPCWMERLSIYI